MDAFDRLPREAREALAAADHNWSAAQAYRVHKSRNHPHHYKVRTGKDIAAFIREQDIAQHNRDAAAGIVMEGQR